MSGAFRTALLLSLLSLIAAIEFHHKERGHGCPSLFGLGDGPRKCLSYCLGRNYCTGICGTSSHSSLTGNSSFGSIKNWCHCYRGESGCHCSHQSRGIDEDEERSHHKPESSTADVLSMANICAGNGTGHDDHSHKCHKICEKEDYCFGTCFDLKEMSQAVSVETCTCYRGPQGCCPLRSRRGVFPGLFGRRHSMENFTSSPSVSASTSSLAPSLDMSTSSPSHSHHKRDLASSSSHVNTDHPMNGNQTQVHGSHSNSSQVLGSSSTTPGSIASGTGHFTGESGLNHSATNSPLGSRLRRHASHGVGHKSYAPYYHPQGCVYETTTSTPPPAPRDVLCIRNGRPILVGDNEDSLCFEAPEPVSTPKSQPLHEKEELFKKPFELFKNPAKV